MWLCGLPCKRCSRAPSLKNHYEKVEIEGDEIGRWSNGTLQTLKARKNLCGDGTKAPKIDCKDFKSWSLEEICTCYRNYFGKKYGLCMGTNSKALRVDTYGGIKVCSKIHEIEAEDYWIGSQRSWKYKEGNPPWKEVAKLVRSWDYLMVELCHTSKEFQYQKKELSIKFNEVTW